MKSAFELLFVQLEPICCGHLFNSCSGGETGVCRYGCMPVVRTGLLAYIAAENPPMQLSFILLFHLNRTACDTARCVDGPVGPIAPTGQAFIQA